MMCASVCSTEGANQTTADQRSSDINPNKYTHDNWIFTTSLEVKCAHILSSTQVHNTDTDT